MQPQQSTLPHRTASTITVATADQNASKTNTTSLSSSAASVRSITPATPVTPIIPSPTASASASAEVQHMSVRDFNGGEVREWLRRSTTTTITPVLTSAPSAVKPTSPAWASKPSITAAGQDFWMLLRRQMYTLESVGGSGSGSGSGSVGVNNGHNPNSTNK